MPNFLTYAHEMGKKQSQVQFFYYLCLYIIANILN